MSEKELCTKGEASAISWYANRIGKAPYEFDEYDLYCSRIAGVYAKELLSEAINEIELEEQNITANMDAKKAFDLAKDALLDYIKSKYE